MALRGKSLPRLSPQNLWAWPLADRTPPHRHCQGDRARPSTDDRARAAASCAVRGTQEESRRYEACVCWREGVSVARLNSHGGGGERLSGSTAPRARTNSRPSRGVRSPMPGLGRSKLVLRRLRLGPSDQKGTHLSQYDPVIHISSLASPGSVQSDRGFFKTGKPLLSGFSSLSRSRRALTRLPARMA